MAMKVHRQGNDASKLLKLLGFNRIVFSRGLQDVSPHHNLSVEMWCRIVDNSFLVRKQIVYRIRSAGNWYWFRCLICPHIELRRARALVNQKTCLVKVNYGRTGLRAQFVADNGLEQCRYCNTEFQLNFQLVETEKLLLIITAWHDIGKGLSSRDPQWLKQTEVDGKERNTRWHATFFQPGLIAATFEGGTPFNYESLISQEDLKKLC